MLELALLSLQRTEKMGGEQLNSCAVKVKTNDKPSAKYCKLNAELEYEHYLPGIEIEILFYDKLDTEKGYNIKAFSIVNVPSSF